MGGDNKLLSSMRLCALDVANCMPNLNDPTTSTAYRPAPAAPEHLNITGCKIKYSEEKGREVYGMSALTVHHTSRPSSPSIIHSIQAPARAYITRDQPRVALLN